MGRGSDQVLRDLLGLQEKIYRLFDEQSERLASDREPAAPQWSPPVDIYESREAFLLLAEIPGVDQDQIGLEITADLLVLRGDRPLNTEDPEIGYHRVERPNGLFQRVFRLPAEVDPAGVRASCLDGVLQVTLPKREGARGRSISVEAEE